MWFCAKPMSSNKSGWFCTERKLCIQSRLQAATRTRLELDKDWERAPLLTIKHKYAWSANFVQFASGWLVTILHNTVISDQTQLERQLFTPVCVIPPRGQAYLRIVLTYSTAVYTLRHPGPLRFSSQWQSMRNLASSSSLETELMLWRESEPKERRREGI